MLLGLLRALVVITPGTPQEERS